MRGSKDNAVQGSSADWCHEKCYDIKEIQQLNDQYHPPAWTWQHKFDPHVANKKMSLNEHQPPRSVVWIWLLAILLIHEAKDIRNKKYIRYSFAEGRNTAVYTILLNRCPLPYKKKRAAVGKGKLMHEGKHNHWRRLINTIRGTCEHFLQKFSLMFSSRYFSLWIKERID